MKEREERKARRRQEWSTSGVIWSEEGIKLRRGEETGVSWGVRKQGEEGKERERVRRMGREVIGMRYETTKKMEGERKKRWDKLYCLGCRRGE